MFLFPLVPRRPWEQNELSRHLETQILREKMLPRATPGAARLSQPGCFDGPSELYKPPDFQNLNENQEIASLPLPVLDPNFV